MQYGVDVAVRRADDLDKLMLEEIAVRKAHNEGVTALDIGCGAGGQSRRLALRGADVTAIDILDYTEEFAVINNTLQAEGLPNPISFIQANVLDWVNVTSTSFDIVALQRTLHYFPYQKAKKLLEALKTRTTSTLYLSVTGATSAIADNYPSLSVPIEERFAVLSPDAQVTFSISAPLCIYHESEILDLLNAAGWEVARLHVSDFGNIKAVARS